MKRIIIYAFLLMGCASSPDIVAEIDGVPVHAADISGMSQKTVNDWIDDTILLKEVGRAERVKACLMDVIRDDTPDKMKQAYDELMRELRSQTKVRVDEEMLKNITVSDE